MKNIKSIKCKNCNGTGVEKITALWLIWNRVCKECNGTGKIGHIKMNVFVIESGCCHEGGSAIKVFADKEKALEFIMSYKPVPGKKWEKSSNEDDCIVWTDEDQIWYKSITKFEVF